MGRFYLGPLDPGTPTESPLLYQLSYRLSAVLMVDVGVGADQTEAAAPSSGSPTRSVIPSTGALAARGRRLGRADRGRAGPGRVDRRPSPCGPAATASL